MDFFKGKAEKRKKDIHFLLYQLQVTVLVFLAFGYLLWKGADYIYLDIGADTYCNYWPRYTFYRNLFENWQGLWSFKLGLGNNILDFTSLMLDPFNLCLFLFPSEQLNTGLLVTTVLKYYVLSWLAYAYLKKFGFQGVPLMIGSLCYTFSGYFVGWGQHYQFATAFICMSLCLYAFEYWFQTGKWLGFTASVAIMAIFSLYFSYIVLLFLGIYVFFRYFSIYPFRLRALCIYGLRLLLYVLSGLGAAAAVVLPQAFILLGSARITGDAGISLRPASLLYYFGMFIRLLSNNGLGIHNYFGAASCSSAVQNYYEAPFLFVGVIAAFFLPVLLKRDALGKTGKIAGLCIMGALFFVGISGPVFNGFSTITLRWTMVLVPVMCLGICRGAALYLREPRKYRRYALLGGEAAAAILAAAIFAFRPIFGHELNGEAARYLSVPLIVLLLYLTVFTLWEKRGRIGRWLPAAVCVVLTADLGLNLFFSVDLRGTSRKKEASYFDGTIPVLAFLKEYDPGFYRVEKSYRQIDLTDPMMQGYNGEKQYSSTATEDFWNFLETYDLRYSHSNYFYGFDDKQALRNIAGGKYLLSRQPVTRAGYRLLKQTDDIWVYENTNALPLAFLQARSVLQEDLENLPLQNRQEILYEGFITDEEDVKERYADARAEMQAGLPWEGDMQLVQDESGNGIGLILSEPSRQTLLLRLTCQTEGLNVGQAIKGNITARTESGEEYAIPLYTVYRGGRLEAEIEILPLEVREIYWDILTPQVGLRCKDDSSVAQKCRALQENAMSVTSFSDSRITGKVSVRENAMLVTSIPYDAGWSVRVDGQPAPVHKVNMIFSGTELSPGEHDVEWSYSPPGLKTGSVISAGTAAVLILVLLAERTGPAGKKSKGKDEEKEG